MPRNTRLEKTEHVS